MIYFFVNQSVFWTNGKQMRMLITVINDLTNDEIELTFHACRHGSNGATIGKIE